MKYARSLHNTLLKSSILDVWQDSVIASEASNDLRKSSSSDVRQSFEFAFVAINY